jgi:ribosomal protein L21E
MLPKIGQRVTINADALWHSACPNPELYRDKTGVVIQETKINLDTSDPCYDVAVDGPEGYVIHLYTNEMDIIKKESDQNGKKRQTTKR